MKAFFAALMIVFGCFAIACAQEPQKPSIVMFTASWCPNCPSQKKICQTVALERNVECIMIDIDQQPALAAKWDVKGTVPTTFVMMKKDNKLVATTKVVGISSVAKMTQYIEEAR